MIKHVKNVSVLVAICLIVSVLLSVTHYFTAPIIKAEQER